MKLTSKQPINHGVARDLNSIFYGRKYAILAAFTARLLGFMVGVFWQSRSD
jgi:hypothetical protein